MHSFFRRLLRKKVLSDSDIEESNLNRCLTTFDLIGLGIGSTLGAGLYVIGGQVAQHDAGPAVVVSFFIAAVASALAGICYAEFAARIPRAGSAYVYSYVTVGELMAFIIGWNLVLEYVIGTASVARGWSGYFDAMIDKKLSTFFNSTMPMHIDELSAYPDFFAFGITILVTVLLAFGVKESARFNNIFTIVNLLIVLYVIICGLFKLDGHNWNLDPSEIPSTGAGTGGFMPYGFSGMMKGAATCFYAFVGFDCVATTGEETKNPQKAIPIAIVTSLFIIFLSYCGVSAIITLMCPYYLIDHDAPLPFVFSRVGWGVARYIISIGAVCGLSTSLLGGMFPLPRILYAMAGDGVIFRFMGKVSPRFKTPLMGTIISGIFAGLMAMFFNLDELVDMMSIGTLLAYTLVGVSVLILRYEADENLTGSMSVSKLSDSERLLLSRDVFSVKKLLFPGTPRPTLLTAYISKWTLLFLCLFVIFFAAFAIFGSDYLEQMETWAIIIATLLALLPAMCVIILQCQPQSEATLAFKVPLVPLLPSLSVLVNIYLMLKLSPMTWVRFGVWMAIGMSIYLLYGVGYNLSKTSEAALSDGSVVEEDVNLIEKEDHRNHSYTS
ncbi:cationic amino acid transporter 2-like isoform X2 [Biomphalaria glabrata]|uniref:Cationic amino acid transporter 2-like isoform X2 n=1 Tax=Biomphalaria glabrata TaxID=6526 RepID=A0A9W2YMC7_BIOGL|nr:cationic amino acid transporter 2-like isoform X2 [Biomphalaria glabrata]KAI8795876.1 cationic amino acid transporter 2 [Biomphalaria glabrata]